MCSFKPPRPDRDPRDEKIRELKGDLADARTEAREATATVKRYRKHIERLRNERDALRGLPPPSPPPTSAGGDEEAERERQRIRRAVKQCIRTVHPDKAGDAPLDATAVTKMLTELMESV